AEARNFDAAGIPREVSNGGMKKAARESRAAKKFYIFSCVYLTGRTPNLQLPFRMRGFSCPAALLRA
ncbi:hypothetical protein, partial [Selenomonas sp.]|uniref:hypothetical protein n=1 Tax=Selenomonas sp. TaxID=2053611 RepID=UPI0025D3424B